MMNIDERIERLINRRLDGELTEEEQLELNRELIRNPQANRLLEEYQQIDDLACVAMMKALDREETVPVLSKQLRPATQRVAAAEKQWRVWWLVPGAIAAALLAVALSRFTVIAPNTVAVNTPFNGEIRHRLPADQSNNMTVGFPTDNQPRINRKTNRNGYGVIGQDGKLYWIEVDHIRTVTRPSPQTEAQLDRGGM